MASYLGFDFSTQQIKVVALDEDLNVVYENFVKFDSDLPHYGTQDGVLRNGLRIVSPTLMWIEALDLLMEKAKKDKFDFSSVKALSGAGQQHGSVYWRRGAAEKLSNLDPALPLKEQLKNAFAVANSPVWMDGSTTAECARLVDAVGGEEVIADLTGSIAFERFTAAQILKIATTDPEAYANTERISLVSSFAATLFCGHYASIDFSDASGMNLMDIRKKEWLPQIVKLIGADLPDKLGPPQFAGEAAGPVSGYFARRFGLPEDCRVFNFTGDNPASLAGMRLGPGDLCLSLGTSDVLILWLEACPNLGASSACILANPVERQAFMALICFKNGSLVRERFRAGRSWVEFNAALSRTSSGNDGKIGIFFDEMEITPRNRQGAFRFDSNDLPVTSFPPDAELRALVEGQVLAKMAHAQRVGLKLRPGAKVLVTGGASVNKELMQIIADVFNASVYNAEIPNSAALGSAFRAKHMLEMSSAVFQETVRHLGGHVLVASPNEDAAAVYGPMVDRYRRLEDSLDVAV